MLRRALGAVRNGIVWGGAWFALATAVAAPIRLLSGEVSVPIALGDALFMGARVGFIGGIVGGAFAILISVCYRGRRLAEISWLRFGVGGAILAGLFVPAFLLAGNLVSGDGFPTLRYILDDGIMAMVFGGITAAGSMKLAQHADRLSAGAGSDQLESPREAESTRVESTAYAATRRAAD